MSDSAFFLLAKIVGLALVAETWIALALGLGFVALLAGRLRLARAATGLALLLLLSAGLLPLGNLLMAPLEAEYPADPPLSGVTGIILLGGAEDPPPAGYWGQPQLNDAGERVIAAAALARRYPEAVVVVSGGSGQIERALTGDGSRRGEVGGPMPEAELVATLLAGLGVDRSRMVLEGRSRNTVENARFSHALVRPDGAGTWVLVTSAFHMGRAMQSFENAGWTGLVAWPVDFRTTGTSYGMGWDMAAGLRMLNLALKEQVGRIAYRVTGR